MSRVSTALLILVCAGVWASPLHARGNILLVIADEVGVQDVSTYRQNPRAAPTPHLDALAAEGVLFRNAWSHPNCSPTRLALLTGLHASRTGCGNTVAWNGAYNPAAALSTVPELLPAAYTSALIGKWHLTNNLANPMQKPVIHGFDLHCGSIKNLGPDGTYTNWEKNVAVATGNVQVQSRTYATTANVDDALAFIADTAGPWLCVLAFNAAHNPWHTPPAELHGIAAPSSLRHQFRAAVEAMDTELGRLLASIDPGVRQDTTVIYVGDNGPPSQVTWPFVPVGRAKGSVYEGGVHVPLIIASADVVAPGREHQALVSDVDLFPTLLDLAGADAIPATDGASLVPYLHDPQHPEQRSWAFTQRFIPNGPGPHTMHHWAARERRYKLIDLDGVQHLYDLAADPGERIDLLEGALDPRQQAAYDRLLAVGQGIVD